MKSKILAHLKIFAVILTALIVYDILDISCPFRYFVGIPCPSCGVTRSLWALMNFDISLSLFYNPMTVLIILLFLFAMHKDLLCKAKISNIIIIGTSSIIFIVYVFRLIYDKIP